jgi:hypothetical protein
MNVLKFIEEKREINKQNMTTTDKNTHRYSYYETMEVYYLLGLELYSGSLTDVEVTLNIQEHKNTIYKMIEIMNEMVKSGETTEEKYIIRCNYLKGSMEGLEVVKHNYNYLILGNQIR